MSDVDRRVVGSVGSMNRPVRYATGPISSAFLTKSITVFPTRPTLLVLPRAPSPYAMSDLLDDSLDSLSPTFYLLFPPSSPSSPPRSPFLKDPGSRFAFLSPSFPPLPRPPPSPLYSRTVPSPCALVAWLLCLTTSHPVPTDGYAGAVEVMRCERSSTRSRSSSEISLDCDVGGGKGNVDGRERGRVL